MITTQNWVRSDDRFVIGEDAFQRVVSYTEEAEIHYAYNRSNVRSAELRDDDIVALKDFLGFAADHDSVMLKGTSVSAYASPEGEISLNEDLAMERAESANAAIAKMLRREKIEVEEGFYGNNPKGEDWEGFQTHAFQDRGQGPDSPCSPCTATRTAARRKSKTSPRPTRRSRRRSCRPCVAP